MHGVGWGAEGIRTWRRVCPAPVRISREEQEFPSKTDKPIPGRQKGVLIFPDYHIGQMILGMSP